MSSSASRPAARLHGASLPVLAALVVVVACAPAAVLKARAQQQPSQQGWAWQNPLPQGNAIHAVRFAADKLSGWAVGAGGVILRTRDGGFRWDEQHSGTASTLYASTSKTGRRPSPSARAASP